MKPRWLSFTPVVPESWDAVTPEWMTAAIRSRHPDAVVDRVSIVTRDDGTNRRARFALDYAQGTGPATVFVKAHAPAHRWVHFRNGNLFGESRLFASGTPIPVDHPMVYLAVPDYPRLDFLLVMEDLNARGADCRDSTRPMNVAQVADAMTGLARLHSHYWGMTATSHPALKWVKPWAPSQGWQVGLRRRIPIGLSRSGDGLPAAIAGMSGDKVVDLWVDYVSTLGSGGQTLLHGDAHIGNSYVLPGDKVGFLDWQVVRRGNWSQDVGYFLVGALTVEDRRAHERELLDIYRGALTLPASQAPSADEVWNRYRQSHAYGLAIWLSTLGTDGWQPRAICEALVERYAAAFVDAETTHALAKSPLSVN
ncbi:MAG TPA: oxidoreductase family protein [Sphingobium sp.]|uniref:oxidoreductase family protein n=1 Tax=Sphingobium sp. TaxID=1912891 RepID=UPI002ED124F2